MDGWLVQGETIAPIEPSESMQFSKEGVVNPGLVFFALAILATLVLGRWMCGWACHLLALQDGALWVLEKLKLKPRRVDLGVLGWIPWLAFVYMFLAPIVWRGLQGIGLEEPTVRLTTTSVIAASSALSKFSAKAGEANRRENNQPTIVYSA